MNRTIAIAISALLISTAPAAPEGSRLRIVPPTDSVLDQMVSDELERRASRVPSEGVKDLPVPIPPGGKAYLAKQGWAAFICANFAAVAEMDSEFERLFWVGFHSLREFIRAIEASEISQEDLDGKLPVTVAINLRGPTPDFAIGRVYGGAADNASDSMSSEQGKWTDNGRYLYQKNNCDLLG